METRGKVLASLFLIILLSAFLLWLTSWLSHATGYSVYGEEHVTAALCLQQKHAILYVRAVCPSCTEQKELLGPALSFIALHNCDTQPELCPSLDSLPAWSINSKLYYGIASIEKLKEIAGC